ncbi:MAG: hypothetical protein IJW70_02785 [Clostridia bacterium]|nr:hypothetical protein [Clostridia bacterium]
MQIKQNTKQVRVMQSGAVVLRAQATYVTAEGEGFEKFNACYENAAMAYLKWAEHKQGKMLQEEYATQKSDRMFGFRPMICRMDTRVVWQQGQFLSVVTDSIRNSGTPGEYPICHRNADVWDMGRGVVIPLKYFLMHVPALRGIRVGGKRPEGIWLEQDGAVLYHNAGADGYAELRTGLHIGFVPRKGGGVQDFVPVLADHASDF